MSTMTQLPAAAGSETLKFLSLRSLVGLWLAGVLSCLALGWLLGFSAYASGLNGYDTAMPAPLMVFSSLQFGQLLFASAVLLHTTGEYTTGQMGHTLQAVPRRWQLVCAKSAVAAAAGFIGGVIGIGLGTIPTALAAGDFGVFELGDLISAAQGAGVYLALLGLMCVGLGLLLRNAVGAMVAMLMLVIGLPQVLVLIPVQWVQEVIQYLPTNAATFMATGATEPYPPAVALLILVGWAALLLGAGAWRLSRSDA